MSTIIDKIYVLHKAKLTILHKNQRLKLDIIDKKYTNIESEKRTVSHIRKIVVSYFGTKIRRRSKHGEKDSNYNDRFFRTVH